ncbi:dockerin type I domain-containing protein [Crateriforma conspicua]|uniref:Dockerin type I repeat protein n=1 Tax=Crateriforma conspicua TaxID=2527996 RepID=A0A5C6FID1_9PLAN|nr:dockerin type I domain-containing protein [Crateriforma conspicua]TWU61727.1 hypothetical protein V7x_34150 [Crateriforma conspicua]
MRNSIMNLTGSGTRGRHAVRRRLQHEQLSKRELLAAEVMQAIATATSTMAPHELRTDVNDDGFMTPIDALLVINSLAADRDPAIGNNVDVDLDGTITLKDVDAVFSALDDQAPLGGDASPSAVVTEQILGSSAGVLRALPYSAEMLVAEAEKIRQTIAPSSNPKVAKLDIDEDGFISIDDALVVVHYLAPTSERVFEDRLDANDDGTVTLKDFHAVLYTLRPDLYPSLGVLNYTNASDPELTAESQALSETPIGPLPNGLGLIQTTMSSNYSPTSSTSSGTIFYEVDFDFGREVRAGEGDPHPASYEITLWDVQDDDVTFNWQVVPPPSVVLGNHDLAYFADPDQDVINTTGSVTIPAGSMSASFEVGIVDDDQLELNEEMYVKLTGSGPPNTTVAHYIQWLTGTVGQPYFQEGGILDNEWRWKRTTGMTAPDYPKRLPTHSDSVPGPPFSGELDVVLQATRYGNETSLFEGPNGIAFDASGHWDDHLGVVYDLYASSPGNRTFDVDRANGSISPRTGAHGGGIESDSNLVYSLDVGLSHGDIVTPAGNNQKKEVFVDAEAGTGMNCTIALRAGGTVGVSLVHGSWYVDTGVITYSLSVISIAENEIFTYSPGPG